MIARGGSMVTMATNGFATAVPPNYLEFGRLYHGFRKGIYMYPCDETEKDRMDIYHQLFLVARRGHLHQAPINTSNPRILDVGCGTGIWAIDIADKYVHGEVLGLDLVNIQPEQIPPNLRFRVPFDHESIWTLGEDAWDLVHLRQVSGSIVNWNDLYQKVFRHLLPGQGWIEQVEIDYEPRCDDGSMPPNSAMLEWYKHLSNATGSAHRPIAYQHNTRHMLQAAGFIDIQETIIRAPYNSWPADPHQKDVGRWYNLGITEGLEALSFQPFHKIFQWEPAQYKDWLGAVKLEMCNRKIHAYNNIHIWTARKPQQ